VPYFGKWYGEAGSGSAITTLPTIAIVSPAEGAVVGRSVPVVLTVTSDDAALRRVIIGALLDGSGVVEEMVHDGVAFAPAYTGGSNVRVVLGNGFQFTILRVAGWKGTTLRLVVIAVDVFGNLAVKTIGIPQAFYTWPLAS
jgi:hypothetical protein